MKHELYISIEDGKIISGKTLIAKYINSLHAGRYVMTIEKVKRKRTNSQNAFYWSGFVDEEIQCFKEFWGEVYSKQQIHEWNKNNFFAEEQLINDEVIKKPVSTTTFTPTEFEEKLELIRQWFRLKFEWEICYPNEQKQIAYEK